MCCVAYTHGYKYHYVNEPNPLVSAVVNDGSMTFDWEHDGTTQTTASCKFEFRDHAEPSFAKVTYVNQRLTVEIAVSRSAEDKRPVYETCIKDVPMQLGVGKYFGISSCELISVYPVVKAPLDARHSIFPDKESTERKPATKQEL